MRSLVRRSLEASLCFGLYAPEGQIGLVRVITDHAPFAYLCDVYVLPAYEGQGLGRWLMQCVMGSRQLQGRRRWMLVTREARPRPDPRMQPTGVALALALGCIPGAALAQRAALPDDFPGITQCDGGRAISRIRADIRDSLLRAQLEAHEAVHREQAKAFPTCEAFLAGLTSARRIIDVELPAYCAQWRVAVGQGADRVETRREFAWRVAAQSGAMENRLQVVQRFERECDLWPSPGPAP